MNRADTEVKNSTDTSTQQIINLSRDNASVLNSVEREKEDLDWHGDP